MPQPKSSARRKPAAPGRKPASSRKRAPASARSSTTGAAKRTTGAAKRAPAQPRPARSAAGPAPSASTAMIEEMLTALRDLLSRGIVLSGERLQETMDDAVRRGRMTRADAEDLVARLLSTGRKQTEEMLNQLETLTGRGRTELVAASRRVRTQARRAAGPGGDRVLREVDRARRAVGIGPTFPILDYDDLTAAEVSARLADLNSAELRKVRDYERRHADRKSVLDEVERRLK